ncbi:carbonic anhydrase 7-like [Culex pipiens pallens]|uniref:carbonic anhydrase 7-like n=1 Tax=Culex pipiens pallens TaxID=42434 RepID=UPI001953AE27|nr:carbonic anhydrase 7-like [Culex pipiens pallens]
MSDVTSSSESLSPKPQSPVSGSKIDLEPCNLIASLAAKESQLPSPIDINIIHAERIELPKLQWHHYEDIPSKIKMTNTGETVILSAKWPNDVRPYLTGGSLEGRYVFSQLHFHWGNSAVDGSEHTIDGAFLPLELHVVHFSDEYETQEEALQNIGGVLSLVYFFNLKSSPNKFLDPVLTNLKEITFPDTRFKPTPFPIVDLFHTFTDDYFLYYGSTKAESRSHPILWLISRTQECIDFDQLVQFRVLLDQRLRVIQREAPPEVAPLGERHLFHVNPPTPYCNSTLSVLPHPKYRPDQRWLVDRMQIEVGAPGGCQEFVRLLREEMEKKREGEGSEDFEGQI